jgi:hypothetical protein
MAKHVPMSFVAFSVSCYVFCDERVSTTGWLSVT